MRYQSKTKKKLTIIGGAGFIGTYLCKQLAWYRQSFEIIDLKMSKQFPKQSKIGDVRDRECLRNLITGDVVINLAAVHRDDISDINEYQVTNVNGAENVAVICSEKNIKKIIFTSTVAVYGFAEPGTTENGKINPFNDYGRTKFEAEEKLREWQLSDSNSLIIIRPTVVLGEGNRGNVFNLLKQIESGRFLMIGHGTNIKSMSYVENLAAFLVACIETDKKYALYNYADTPDFNMNDLISLVRRKLKRKSGVGLRLPYSVGLTFGYLADFIKLISGKSLPISSIRVKKFCSTTAFKSAKKELDGFQPPFTLKEGIERTLTYEFIEPNQNRELFNTE